MLLKNAKMVEMIYQLQPLLSHRDMIGYAAARNYRFLSESLVEYNMIRRSLIEKYGEDGVDESGASIVSIGPDNPSFKAFCDELKPFNEMEHEIDLVTIKYTDVIGCLTGEEILQIDWMLED